MIRHLAVQRFRNLRRIEVAVEPGGTLLVGATGAGKTSLLEAIYLLATTKSFRTPRLVDCVEAPTEAEEREVGEDASDELGFRIAGEVVSTRRVTLELSWRRATGLERRQNGETTTAVSYLETLPAVVWSSAEGETLVGAPALRRRLLDRGIVALRPASIDLLGQYRRALEHKRRLLFASRRSDPTLLAWNQLLAETGAELARRRQRYVELLARSLNQVLERSELGWPPIRLVYRPSAGEAAFDGEKLLGRLNESEPREREAKRPLVGPHLDRLEILWRGQPVRRQASAGERKAIGLLLLGAQADVLEGRDREPILLLDDLDTELDRRTLEAVSKVFRRSRQWLVTSNRPTVFEGVGIEHRWPIVDGQIKSS